jgi:hypothetical protein
MKTKIISSVFSCLFILGLAVSGAAFAGDTPISIRYAGSGFDTTADPNGDGFPVGVYQVRGQGTFGRSEMSATAEFAPDAEVECERAAEGFLGFSLVYSAITHTFADQSQLFGRATEGWICFNPVSGEYYGYNEGDYVNGTGRFEPETMPLQPIGWWESTWDGYNLDPAVVYRSFRGEITGGLYK